jgi:hypothetical protein
MQTKALRWKGTGPLAVCQLCQGGEGLNRKVGPHLVKGSPVIALPAETFERLKMIRKSKEPFYRTIDRLIDSYQGNT